LGRQYDTLKRRGVEVLAIGGSDVAAARRVQEAFRSPFPILADPDRTVYARYGFGRFALVIQRSGTVLIGRDGRLRMVHRTAQPQKSLAQRQLADAVAALEA